MNIRQWFEGLGLIQYAEAFESLGIAPHEILQLTEEDLKELGVASLVHRRKILQSVAGPSGDTPSSAEGTAPVPPAASGGSLVLERFPFPIAYGYRQVAQPESATHAVDCVFYTYTALLRFTALTFLGQFLSSPGQNPNAAKALRRLQSPTLESWFTAVTTLGKALFPPQAGAGLSYRPFAEGGPFCAGLARAARELPKLRHAGAQVHEQLRTLRNTRAHGAPWDEAECARRLPGLRALLDAALGLFAPLAEIQLLRRSPGGLIRLMGAVEPFAEEEIREPRIEDLFEESETLLLGPDGALLPLFPLFLAPDAPLPEGYTEPLLSFDGHGKSSAMYLGVRSWTARQDTLARYLDLLRAKDIDPRFTKAELTPWGVTDWARETSRGVIENLTGVKYFPEVYQERRASGTPPKGNAPADEDGPAEEAALGVDDAVARWLGRGRQSALIVAAEAGSGKTSLFCRLAEGLLGDPEGESGALQPESAVEDRSDCVLLLLGGEVRGRTTLFERIRDGLGFSDDPARGGIARFDELLAAWQAVGAEDDLDHGKRRILILIDAINEAEDPKRLFEEISRLAADAAAANKHAGPDAKGPWVRLLVSVRAERIETLFARWGEANDTPFLLHPHNFAQFPDQRGRQVPYLGLRRFTLEEAQTAYAAAQAGPGCRCPATWERLAPGTRDLLRHPLMLALFHRAYAGEGQPPALASADTLWDAWLARTFDPAQGGANLERQALDLADACIDGGHDQIPPELAGAWRALWQAEQGNDPIRIAAGLDPLERLVEAGILRRTEGGGLDWVSDSLAEQVLYLALRRRDPTLGEASLAAWLALPVTRRLGGALSRVGAAIWRAGRPLDLLPILGADNRRGRDLLTDALMDVAPRGLPGEVETAAADFAAGLGQLVEVCIAKGDWRWMTLLKDSLLRDLYARLANRWGYGSGRLAVARRALSLAEHLKALEPENTQYLRDLSLSYRRLGALDGRRDPAAARTWFEQGFDICRHLVEQEPDNTQFLSDLSNSNIYLGDLNRQRDPAAAHTWYIQGLEIRRRLAEQQPENTRYMRGLSISYDKLGQLDGRRDPAAARDWYAQGLEIRCRLSALEPENTQYLCDLADSYDSLGDLDRRRDPAAARNWYAQGLEFCRRLVEQQPDNTRFLRALSVSLIRLGDLDERRDPAAARTWFEQGVEICRRLAEQQPDDTQYLSDLAVCYIRLGDLDGRRDPAAARTWVEQGVEICRRLAEQQPDNTWYLSDLAACYIRLGDLDGRRDPAAARTWFEQGLEIRRRLAEQQPDDTQYLSDLADCYIRLGDLDGRRDPAAARTWVEQGLEIRRRLAEQQPDDTQYLSDLAACYIRLGDLDGRRDPAAARTWVEQGVEICRRLAEQQPDNTRYLSDLAACYIRLGDLDRRHDPAAARTRFEQGLEIRRRLAEQQPDDTQYLSDLAACYIRLGDLDGRRDPAAARTWVEQGVEICRRLAEQQPDNTRYLSDLAACYIRLGDLDRRHDPAAARTWFEQGLEIRRRLAEQEPDNTGFLRALSVSYDRLGDLDGRRDAAARDWYVQGLAITRRLAELEAENTQYLCDLGIFCWKLGDTERTRASEEALRWYSEAAQYGERLVAVRPDDTQFLSNLRYYCDRAASLTESADPPAARSWLERGVELGRSLTGLDPSAAQRLTLSRWLVRLGHVEKKRGSAGAEASYREALAIREAVVEAEPENHEAWGLISSALGSLAEWHLGQGNAEDERACSERADRAMERAAALKPDDPDIQYGLACTRARLGHTEEALAALARSAELGHRDADWAAQDPDLRSLRDLPEFEVIVARMRGAAAAPPLS